MVNLIPITPSVAFVGVAPSLDLRDYVIDAIQPLLAEDAMACRVTLEAQMHSRAGSRFRAKIEIDVPHGTLVIGSNREAFGDVHAAVDALAHDTKRILDERTVRASSLSMRSLGAG